MANKKITELNEATSVSGNDWLVIVDVANDETKKVHANQVGGNIPIQNTAPQDPEQDDLWIDTSDNNAIKYYNGVSWELVSGEVSGDTLPIGAIIPFGNTTAPTNWLVCDGSYVSKTTYADLYAVIGDNYLDGGTAPVGTFRLPDYKDRVPVGYDSTDTDFNAIGKTGGEKKHTLTVNEMPSHKHNINYAPPASSGGQGNAYVYGTKESDNNAMILAAGGDQPHNNLQPYQVSCYIIKAFQSSGVLAEVNNTETSSQVDTYSCDYVNVLASNLVSNNIKVVEKDVSVTWTGTGIKTGSFTFTAIAGFTCIGCFAYQVPSGDANSVTFNLTSGTTIYYIANVGYGNTGTMKVRLLFVKNDLIS